MSNVQHLTEVQIQRFCSHTLSDDELTLVAKHIGQCKYCDKRTCEELRRLHPPSTLRFTEDDLAFCVSNCHLDFETLMGLAEGKWDSEAQWLFGLHLKTCEQCAEDLKACERCIVADPTFLDPSRDEDLIN